MAGAFGWVRWGAGRWRWGCRSSGHPSVCPSGAAPGTRAVWFSFRIQWEAVDAAACVLRLCVSETTELPRLRIQGGTVSCKACAPGAPSPAWLASWHHAAGPVTWDHGGAGAWPTLAGGAPDLRLDSRHQEPQSAYL